MLLVSLLVCVYHMLFDLCIHLSFFFRNILNSCCLHFKIIYQQKKSSATGAEGRHPRHITGDRGTRRHTGGIQEEYKRHAPSKHPGGTHEAISRQPIGIQAPEGIWEAFGSQTS